jgi:hypothetical protein
MGSLLTGRTLAAGGLVTTAATAATMGDTISSAIVSALAISAVAIPLADSMQEDSTAVDSTAVADIDKPEEATNSDLLSAIPSQPRLSWLAHGSFVGRIEPNRSRP